MFLKRAALKTFIFLRMTNVLQAGLFLLRSVLSVAPACGAGFTHQPLEPKYIGGGLTRTEIIPAAEHPSTGGTMCTHRPLVSSYACVSSLHFDFICGGGLSPLALDLLDFFFF